MYITNPDPYLLPSFRISPFRTEDISINNSLPDDNYIDTYFEQRFATKNFAYFENGRNAIFKALEYYQLRKDDTVTILTSSNNFYISGCVTSEIEKICKWSRKIVDSTKVIFVNHEFGIPYENVEDLKKYKLPIIEDCAHTFFSVDKNASIGTVGDFVIYSFPKVFSIQIGGLLVSNLETTLSKNSFIDKDKLDYIKKVLSHYIKDEKSITEKRRGNYQKIRKELESLGFTERFELKEGVVPGVFMFKVNNDEIKLDALKSYVQAHGIQCSVFYGERAFFIPVHQNLSEDNLAYFKVIIESFLKKVI